MGRYPYSHPRFENDKTFCRNIDTMAAPLEGPLHKKTLGPGQQPDPWQRLYSTQTLSSGRQGVMHYDPKAPQDSLDFVIKASYNHHNLFMADVNETLLQQETLGGNHGRVLKNRKKKEVQFVKPTLVEPQFRENVMLPRFTTHSVKMAIESHHVPLTNPGYSRKHDGGFYTT